MRFDVLTLFPDIFQGYFTQSILKLALQKGLVEIHVWNMRDWAPGKHHSVDDRPFGGGRAWSSCRSRFTPPWKTCKSGPLNRAR